MRTRRRINPPAVGRRPFLMGLAATVAATPLAIKGAGGQGPLRILDRGAAVDVEVKSTALSDSMSVLVDDAAVATRELVDALHPNRGVVREFRRDAEFSMFALTWRGDADITVFFRAQRADGSWSEWFAADPHNLSSGSDMGSGRNGTELVYLEPTKAVQVSTIGLDLMPDAEAIANADAAGIADSVGIRALDDVQAVFIDGNSADSAIMPITDSTDSTGMPHVITRAGWGADESIVSQNPVIDDKLLAATVHHTAGSNNYSEAEAAGIVRGILVYHAKTLGWGDIGYNALVDKYGNIYEGRAGGLSKNVQGAHAGGFNKGTFGISMMGDYSTAQPTPAMLNAVGSMIGWRMKQADIEPKSRASIVSQGFRNAKYRSGQAADLPAIFAHRDTGDTTCPGDAGYAQMDKIREIAAAKYDALQNGGIFNEAPEGPVDIRADLPDAIAGLPILGSLDIPGQEQGADGEGREGGNSGNGREGRDGNSGNSNDSGEGNSDEGTDTRAQGAGEGNGNNGAQGNGNGGAPANAETFSGGRSILAASLGLAGAPGLGATAGEVLGAVGREPNQGPAITDIPVQSTEVPARDGDDPFAAEWRAVTEAHGDVLGNPRTGVQQGATVANDEGVADPVHYVSFEKGIITSSRATGTHAIWGPIAEEWAKQGFEIGPLGVPTTTQSSFWGAERADFQGGSLSFDPVRGSVDSAVNEPAR